MVRYLRFFLDQRGFFMLLRSISSGTICLAVQKMASSFIIMGRTGINAQRVASYKKKAGVLPPRPILNNDVV